VSLSSRLAAVLSAGLTALTALAATLALAWPSAAPAMAERLLRQMAAGRGIDLMDGAVIALGPTRTEVVDLAVAGDGPRLRRVVATYDPVRLWREGRLDSVRLAGLRGRVAIGPDGVDVPGLGRIPAGGGTASGETGVPVPPIDRITVDDARVAVDTAAGIVDVALDAAATAGAAGAMALQAAGRAESPWGIVAWDLDAAVEADGTVEAGARLRADRLAAADVGALDGLDVWASLAGRPGDWRAAGLQLLVDRLVPAVGPPAAELRDLSIVADGSPRPRLVLVRGRLGEATRLAADLAVPATLGEEPLTADFEIAAESLEDATTLLGSSRPIPGRARLAGHLAVPAGAVWPPPDPAAGLGGLAPVTGMIALSLSDVGGVPGLAGVDATVAADIRVDDGRLMLTGHGPWRVAARPAEAGTPIVARLGTDDEGFALALGRGSADAAVRARAAGPVSLAPGGGAQTALAGHLAATVERPADGPVRVALDALTLAGGPVAYGDVAVRVDRFALSGAGTPAEGRGRVVADLAVDGAIAGASVDAGRVAGRLALSWDPRSARLRIEDCLTLAADALAISGGASARPVSVCLAASGDGPAMAFDRTGAAERPASVDLRLTGEPMTWRSAGLGPVEVTPPAVTLSGTVAPRDRDGRLTLAGQGGAARSSSIGLALSAVDAEAVLDSEVDRPVALDVSIGEARLLRRPAPLVPVRVRAAGGIDRQGALTLAGQAVGASGGLTADLALDHDLATGRGRVEVGVPSLAFAPGVRQPADVFPVLAAAPLTAVTGAVSGRAAFAWDGGVTSRATLTLEDLAVETPFAAAEGLAGTLSADSLLPLRLPAGQALTVGLVDIGLLLESGRVRFGYGADRRLAVSALGFDWADGRLEAEPFAARLDDRSLEIVLTASDVDVATLLIAVPLEGFEATGRLQGRVPVRLTPDTIVIDNAVLETAGPGLIRYRPEGGAEGVAAADGSGGLSLLLEALRDFHYETLKLTLDGRTGDDLSATISVLGANPDLYDGWPVALDVNVGGELDRILRSGLRSLSLGRRTEDALRRRIERAIEGGALDAPPRASDAQ